MSMSVTTPINQSIDRTKRILFDPFDLKKWFVLGFCAWLAHLGESGGGFNTGSHGGGRGGGPRDIERAVSHAWEWVLANLVIVGIVAGLIFLVLVTIWLVITWLNSRGKFMFLDGVVHNRGAVVRPWSEYKREGNSVFLFSIVYDMVATVIVLLILALIVLLAWGDIRVEHFGAGAISAILVTLGGFLPFIIICVLISAILKDFVVPAMYLRRIGVIEGWGIAVREILRPHTGSVVLFYLMKVLLSIVVGILCFIVICALCIVTCCIAMLPYISTVILLPVYVFWRCYSLFFIEQIGREWKVFPVPADTDDLLPRYPA